MTRPVSELRPGMRLSGPVYAPNGLSPLLAAGQVLTGRHLEILAQAQVEAVLVDPGPAVPPAAARQSSSPAARGGGVRTAASGDEDGAAYILARLMRFSRRSPDLVARAVDPAVGARTRTRLGHSIDRVAACAAARDLLLTHGLRPGFLGPAVETALMATIAGDSLGLTAAELDALCVAALLADVGMLMLPREIIDKPGTLSAAELEVVRSHPRIGAQLLEPMSDELGDLVPQVALRHHERRDGSGYPDGLRGARICPEAQLVWLCHLYLAGVTGRAYRAALPPREAMGMVADFGADAADPEIVRAFTDAVSAHPVGALVRLSSGECGVVVEGGDALVPRVEIRWSPSGADLIPQVVDTSRAASGLHVTALGE